MTPYKRSKSLDAPYYVQLTINGRKEQYCTKRTDYQEAITEGMRYAAEKRMGVVLRAEPPPGKFNIQSVVDAYMKDAVHVRESTRKKNVSMFRKVLAASGLHFGDSFAVLTRRVIIKFQTLWIAGHEDDMTRNASANSVVRQARSIFAKRCMPYYEEMGIPDISGFMEHPLMDELDPCYSMPPLDLREKMIAAAADLRKDDPGAYAAHILSLYTGLRASEMKNARWDWMRYSDDCKKQYLELPANTKSKKGRYVPLSADVLAELRSLSGDKEYIVPGASPTARHKAIYRRHSAWLRKQGVTGGKTNHALRKLFGATIASTQGLYAAQKLLGHSNPQLTSDYYADLVQIPDPIPLGKAVGA